MSNPFLNPANLLASMKPHGNKCHVLITHGTNISLHHFKFVSFQFHRVSLDPAIGKRAMKLELVHSCWAMLLLLDLFLLWTSCSHPQPVFPGQAVRQWAETQHRAYTFTLFSVDMFILRGKREKKPWTSQKCVMVGDCEIRRLCVSRC